jgi:hypothetical protein
MSPMMVLSLVDVRGIEPRRIGPGLSDSGLATGIAGRARRGCAQVTTEPSAVRASRRERGGGGRSPRSWTKHQARPVGCASSLVVPRASARRGTEDLMMDLVQMRAANWPVCSHGCR